MNFVSLVLLDDITAMIKIPKWAEPNLIKLIEVLSFFENLDCEKKTKSCPANETWKKTCCSENHLPQDCQV